MTVFSADGFRLGQVIEADDRSFAIERSSLFPKGWRARQEEVKELKGREIYLRRPREALLHELEMVHRREGLSAQPEPLPPTQPRRTEAPLPASSYQSSQQRGELQRSAEESGERRELLGRDLGREEMRIPIADEELEVVKRENPRVAARVHKRVVTEVRELRVPVRREELVIERVPYAAGEGRDVPNAEFKEDHFVVPLVEEEIEIRKHPRIREEVVLRKQSTTEERRVSEPVRRQVVEVERQTEISRASGGHEVGESSSTWHH